MYQLIHNNSPLGYTTTPIYTRMQDNGSYGLCSAREAEYIVYQNTVYPLSEMVIVEVDPSDIIFSIAEQTASQIDYISMMSNIDIPLSQEDNNV